MKSFKTTMMISVSSGALALGLIGCGHVGGFGELTAEDASAVSGATAYSVYDLNKHPLNKTVCDPFSGNTPPTPEQGIKASLFYSGIGVPRYYSAQNYIDQATPSVQSLFFTDMNVPTRMFSEGFSTQTSSVVQDDLGNKLIEFFGLKFETVLKLPDSLPEGDYELGILSDDGAVARVKMGEVWIDVINNDGDHPTRMGCSTQSIHFTRETRLPLELVYYQGPRYHIANVLMWRQASVAGQDPLCGHLGNSYFFDPNQNSKPLQPYKDLLARGWQPIGEDSFQIPSEESYNPCVTGTVPVISEFRLAELFSFDAYLSWKTDIPATSQVLISKVSTGEQILTATNNALVISHQIHIGNLEPGETYKVQAVSISADLGKSVSEEIIFTTIP
ncbi:MAG: hypothetical protein COT73_10815 [Bdellovibrio sp. CG10_big_fil_rev_8_21_14_0_10_47_8]|nr:MAG: hypothetical protein COT73_10815 [Bdellovibrio sp. CG10_big_fil_rev_8_21_14_0_10_47_8]